MEDDQIIQEILQALQSGGAGLVQGGMLGFGDEAWGDGIARAQAENPLTFGIGEAVGSTPWAFFGGRFAKPIRRALASRMGERGAALATAGAFGGAHGFAAGFGGSPLSEAETVGERAMDALPGAAMGAAMGGLFMPGTRAASDLYDNLPALAGRVANPEGGFTRAALGQGTRRSAPLNVSLAGEGTIEERAAAAIMAALRQDEARMVADTGKSVLGRWANQGDDLVAFDAPNAGKSLRGLMDYATSTPAGAKALNTMADEMVENAARAQAKNLRAAPKTGARTRTPLPKARARDLLDAVDDTAAHESWVQAVNQLNKSQKQTLGRALIRKLRAEAGNDPAAFRARLKDKNLRAKMEALGVDVKTKGRGTRPVDPETDAKAQLLRSRTQRPEGGYRLNNMDDADLANAGRLSDEDALALIAAARQPLRAYRVQPDSGARALTGAFERGVRFNPRGYLDVPEGQLEAAVIASQPAAAFAHNLPYMTQSEEERIRKLERLLAGG